MRQPTSRTRTIFEQIPDPVIILDKENRVEQLNDAASDLLRGLPGSDTPSAGKDGESELPWLRQELEAFSAAGKSEYRCEKVMEATGGIRYFEVSIKGIMRANKNPDGTVLVLHEITPHRLAEEARRQVEERRDDVFTNNLLVGMYIVQEGRFCYVNAAMTRALGYGTDDIVGKMAAVDLVHPDDRPMVEDYYKKRLVGEEVPPAYTCKIIRKDGSFGHCLMYNRVIDYGGRPAFVGMALDVTEQERAREALKLSEEKYRSLVESSSDAILMLDTQRTITSCNQAFLDLFGYEREEVENRSVRLIHASDASFDLYGQKAYPVIQKQGTFRVEWDFVRKDGTTVQVESVTSAIKGPDGAIKGFAGIIRDVTERKKSEQALKESEERYRTAIEHSNDGVVITRESRHVYVNQRFLDMFGYDGPDEVLGTFIGDASHMHPQDRERMAETARRRQAGEATPSRYEHRAVHKGGRMLHVEVSATRIVYQGEPAFLSYLRDITERKQAERNQSLSVEILGTLNEPLDLPDVINRILAAIQRETGFDAVGIRLRDGDDFPYFAQSGFSHDFLLTENTLIARNKNGGLCRDKNGNISLECTCGLILAGQTDPANPLFTEGGSCWTNNSLPLLDLPADQDPRLHPRNNCIHQGYCSIALIPIRANREIVGLLQLNDRKKDCLTLEMIQFFEGISASIGVALMRKQAEEELEDREKTLQAFFNAVHETVVLINTEGTVMLCNAVGAQRLGKPVPEIVGTCLYDHFLPDVTRHRKEHYDKVIATGESIYFEDTRSGRSFEQYAYPVFDEERKVMGITIFASDITERKQAEEELQKSEEKYRSLVENAIEGIFQTTPEGRFLSANPALARLIGFDSPQELMEQFTDISRQHYANPEDRQTYKNILERDGIIEGFETQLLNKDGNPIWASISARAIRNDEGTIIHYEGIVEDITERKQAEERIRASLKEKEVLLKEIHHRVKNNLQIVSSLLFLQASRTEHPGAVSALKESRNRVKSMALIHERLYQSPDLASVDMGGYTRNLISDLRHSYNTEDSSVRITLNIDDIPLGITEAIPCGLIINELVSNALKHAFPNGKEGEITIELARGNTNRITLNVSDNGIGFPEHVDFRRSPSLGLTLVNSLVDQLDGAIELDQSGGTTFTIMFG